MKNKKIFSVLLSFVMLVSMMPAKNAMAEEETYPYMIFAASSQAGAVSIEADYLCANGDIATNGTVVSSVDLETIGGEVTEHAGSAMVNLEDKIASVYFSAEAESYYGDYSSDEMNQSIKQPFTTSGQMNLKGNVSLDTAIRAEGDIVIDGETMNANECVIYSVSGDIIIESDAIGLTGLLYAPEGNIVIKASGMNLNRVVLIAQTVSLACPSINMNYSENVGAFISGASMVSGNIDAEETDTEENALEDIKAVTSELVKRWEISEWKEQLRERLASLFEDLANWIRNR